MTHKSWQPAQNSSSLKCIPTHSPTFGEGTKCPQGLWLGEAHMEMVGLDTVDTLGGGGAGCKVRTGAERKNSLQQLGADKHECIMHQLECHR